jgi:hypothetical protein
VPRAWRPAQFQGRRRTRRYFEGWYFKSVSADGAYRLAVIPGVSLAEDSAQSHCFVQVNDGTNGRSAYHRWPLAEFRPRPGRFCVSVGPNCFSLDGIDLNIDRPEGQCRGRLEFSGVHGWPVRLLAPGAMGPFRFVPMMECYHGVLSFDHRLSGRVEVDGASWDFTGGKGYCEKDWGRSMPSAWVWLQCGHFGDAAVSLSASIARVPWAGSAFTGHIVGLWLAGRLVEFVTWNGSRLAELTVGERAVRFALERGRSRLEVDAERAAGASLAAPEQGAMSGRISETLGAAVHVKLAEGGTTVFQGEGRFAGLEVVGPVHEMVRAGRAE